MLTKAIIEEISEGGYSARVRIPIYNKLATDVDATRTSDLPIAYYCCPPGMKPNYSVGDIVYVEFELDEESSPVILGALSRPNSSKSTCDIHADSLKVDVNATLPVETSIGKVSKENIMYLESSGGQLQSQLNYLTDATEKNAYAIINQRPVGSIYFSTYAETPQDMIGGVWIRAAQPFNLQIDSQKVPVYTWIRKE